MADIIITAGAGEIPINAESKAKLTEHLDKHLDPNGYTNYLTVKRTDCGCQHDYPTKADVPSTSTVCIHSNDLIKYW